MGYIANPTSSSGGGGPPLVLPVAVEDGGTGQVTAPLAFDALKQPASTTYEGVIVQATDADFIAGTGTAYPDAETIRQLGVIEAADIALTGFVTRTLTGFGGADFPSWVKRITLNLLDVSTSNTSSFGVQMVTSAGTIIAGYAGGCCLFNSGSFSIPATALTTFFQFRNLPSAATVVASMTVEFTRSVGNRWFMVATGYDPANTQFFMARGSILLANPLLRMIMTTSDGVGTFDSGVASLSYS